MRKLKQQESHFFQEKLPKFPLFLEKNGSPVALIFAKSATFDAGFLIFFPSKPPKMIPKNLAISALNEHYLGIVPTSKKWYFRGNFNGVVGKRWYFHAIPQNLPPRDQGNFFPYDIHGKNSHKKCGEKIGYCIRAYARKFHTIILFPRKIGYCIEKSDIDERKENRNHTNKDIIVGESKH